MDSPTDAGQLPPTLPAKQRRSLYSRSSSTSSVDLNSKRSSTAFVSPLSSPSLPSGSFSLPSSPSCDCFAPQCPIHHRYEPSDCHQERYHSENTPPPVPKKRLARTLSLPGEFPSSSYMRPALLQRFTNPLSMLSPLEDAVFDPGSSAQEGASEMDATQPSSLPPPPLLPLPLLNFDTPEKQLPHFFSNLADRAQVSESMQQHLLLFLRSTAERMEKGVRWVEEGEVVQMHPQDLVFCRGDPILVTQDQVLHHRVRCGSLQGQEFSVQVRRESSTPIPSPQQPHPNVQLVIAHFPAGKQEIPNAKEKRGIVALAWPQGGSSDVEMEKGSTAWDGSESTVLSLLSQGYCVTIGRDLTQGSLEEFVMKGGLLLHCQPEVYHRRLLLLLLQVTQALQHLKTHGIQVTDLDPRNILLAWRENGGDGEKLKRREHKGSQGANVKRGMSNCDREDGVMESSTEEQEEKEGEERGGKAEHLWRRWGTPRVVLTLCTSTTKSSQPITSHHIQLGLLLQRCLHLPEGTASYTKAPPDSPYSQGLGCLLSQLLMPECKIQMADVVPMLQALLWGPRAPFFQHSPSDPTTVHNWLLVKRALLLLKVAERGLFSDQLAVDWEDYLCLQYFSLTDPHTVLTATAKLGLHKTEL